VNQWKYPWEQSRQAAPAGPDNLCETAEKDISAHRSCLANAARREQQRRERHAAARLILRRSC